MADDEQRHRLVVLGAERVGKSAILARFLRNVFSIQYKATIEDLLSRDFVVNGSSVKVDFLDTAGNNEFPAMRRLSISTAHAFLVVYAVDDLESFDEARRLWQEIKQQRPDHEDIPCVFAANKCDLGADRHRVSEAEGLRWAESEGRSDSWFEVSAKLNTSVRDIFVRLLDQARMSRSSGGRGGNTVSLAIDVLKRQQSANSPQPQRSRTGGGRRRLSRWLAQATFAIRQSSLPRCRRDK
jgi:small GTP-binding protein